MEIELIPKVETLLPWHHSTFWVLFCVTRAIYLSYIFEDPVLPYLTVRALCYKSLRTHTSCNWSEVLMVHSHVINLTDKICLAAPDAAFSIICNRTCTAHMLMVYIWSIHSKSKIKILLFFSASADLWLCSHLRSQIIYIFSFPAILWATLPSRVIVWNGYGMKCKNQFEVGESWTQNTMSYNYPKKKILLLLLGGPKVLLLPVLITTNFLPWTIRPIHQ